MTEVVPVTNVRMSRAEVTTLLGMILSAGHRISVGREAVAAWGAALTGYSLGECLAALVIHTQHSNHPPLAHDLIVHIRAARRKTLDAQVLAASAAKVDPAEAANAAEAHMSKIRAAMGWKRPDAHISALSVACPVPECLAAAGTPCRRTGARRKGRPDTVDLHKGVHASRTERAEQCQAERRADTLPHKEIPA
ncbi:hypothetical protein [Lentzea sp. NBRC 102530]|uniref:zinc finger domain-containing protein n=1 Tax=Lentzea sp. NBRC 102530 TaxID=3032201 RepID=UPI0024A4BC44|nr:hypothetical protein [Lentzea sp. NBRC 102530]GLY51319.1 hypothetical protein Lesp01_49750 [Lentzea sp. NBRC 102530]